MYIFVLPHARAVRIILQAHTYTDLETPFRFNRFNKLGVGPGIYRYYIDDVYAISASLLQVSDMLQVNTIETMRPYHNKGAACWLLAPGTGIESLGTSPAYRKGTQTFATLPGSTHSFRTVPASPQLLGETGKMFTEGFELLCSVQVHDRATGC